MSKTEQAISIGEPMPRLASVAHHGAYEITVEWAAPSTRAQGSTADVVDLAPLVLTHKLYKPLRDNPDLLKTVHMIEDGSAIAWGVDDAIDMAATSIERLVEEQMSPADFRAWLEQNKLTYDAAAAQLGISRRLVAYYANQRPVPRYIALAILGISTSGVGAAVDAVAWGNRPGINKKRTRIGKAKGARGQFAGGGPGRPVLAEHILPPPAEPSLQHRSALPGPSAKPVTGGPLPERVGSSGSQGGASGTAGRVPPKRGVPR
jgi:hypothetical protein